MTDLRQAAVREAEYAVWRMEFLTFTPEPLVRTPAGIVIGCAYVPPPPRMEAESLDIQRALLAKPKAWVDGERRRPSLFRRLLVAIKEVTK